MSIGRPQSHDLSLGVRDPQDAVNGSYYVAADKVDCDSTRPQAEDVYLAKNKRLKERDTGGKALHGLSSKRKQMLEDASLLKNLKINETESGPLKEEAVATAAAVVRHCCLVNHMLVRLLAGLRRRVSL